jgi:quinol monooxygenase YgiN
MIRVTGNLVCSTSDDVALVLALLPEHIRLSRAELGCLGFSVSQSTDPLIWVLDETFADSTAFEAHQTRTRASEWFDATRHLGRDFLVTDTSLPGLDAE